MAGKSGQETTADKVKPRPARSLGRLPMLLLGLGMSVHAVFFLTSPVQGYTFHSDIAGELAFYLYVGCVLLWLAIVVVRLWSRKWGNAGLYFIKGLLFFVPTGPLYLIFYLFVCLMTSPSIRDRDESALNQVEYVLSLELPLNTKVHAYENDYLDFLIPLPGGISDGAICFVLDIPQSELMSFSARLEKSPSWNPTPLSDDLLAGWNFIRPSDKYDFLTKATGYYCFIDYQEGDDEPFHGRNSFDLAFAFFDLSTGKLYFILLNT